MNSFSGSKTSQEQLIKQSEFRALEESLEKFKISWSKEFFKVSFR